MAAVEPGSPTALRWWFAIELRRLREAAGITREQAAAAIRGSVAAVGHMETGRNLPKPLEIDALLALYGVAERSEYFQDLRARARRGRDWWIGFSGAVPAHLNLFLALETSAVEIESYDAIVISGLFQTRETASALMRSGDPDLTPEEIDQNVELRMARQAQVLDRDDPPRVWSVVTEPALRWHADTPQAHRDQLDHLLELSERPNIELQVLPFAAGPHIGAGADGTFVILSAPSQLRNYPGCVYVEDHLRGHYYEEQDALLTYRNSLNRLRVQALRPDASRDLIHNLKNEAS